MADAVLFPEDLSRDLAPLRLWREKEAVAEAAIQLLRAYREIAPLGRRLVSLPPVWTSAHEEVLLLFRHVAETLGELRPSALLVMEAFADRPETTPPDASEGREAQAAHGSALAPAFAEPAGDARLPNFEPPELLAAMIEHLDALAPVAALCEADRSLFPVHVAEISAEAEAMIALEAWLLKQANRAAWTPSFLWKLAASLEHHLAHAHIFDRSESEHGVLTIIDRVLGGPEP
jgi:hypothetical protein